MRNGNPTLALLRAHFFTAVAGTFLTLGVADALFFTGAFHWLGVRLAGILGAAPGLGVALIAVVFALAWCCVMSLLSMMIGFMGSRELRFKLSTLAEASALFAAGKLNHRIAMAGEDDLAATANQLNVMAQRLQDQVLALQEAARHNQELQQSAETAATLRERERVRRELHDRVSQDLFGLSMLCGAASAGREKKPEASLQLLPEIADLAKRTQGAMRALLLELRPVELNQRNLTSALEHLTKELAARTSLSISFSYSEVENDADGVLHQSVEDALFLIAQEALINALRHAGAKMIEVQLSMEADRIVLRICDDGEGIAQSVMTASTLPSDKMTAVGLRSMLERAEQIGGSCVIRRMSDKGTEVLTIIPIIRGANR